MIRKAIVTGARDRKEIAAYLPSNYIVMEQREDDMGKTVFVIIGNDEAGWTLDDYVIPRLASGLMGCKEIGA